MFVGGKVVSTVGLCAWLMHCDVCRFGQHSYLNKHQSNLARNFIFVKTNILFVCASENDANNILKSHTFDHKEPQVWPSLSVW